MVDLRQPSVRYATLHSDRNMGLAKDAPPRLQRTERVALVLDTLVVRLAAEVAEQHHTAPDHQQRVEAPGLAVSLQGEPLRAPQNQFGLAQTSAMPAASLCGAPGRALFVAKADGPWTPLIAHPRILKQGVADIALAKYSG